ncbi:hypothetical protein MGYG_01554 [Nannizzia gypsea CBS 118893]|uniref:Uncharacterized protein n=1 Tax=Arthroderma gypseum (strain ATCC MYA-4604 / CBS 118893) TaxID=535722 RepID=E5R1J1_ARTGP|nr:hypothetical protein MGYG_01554 [Nannizzia gypsea CBS 118893]EFQ98527.1 hypothetical protein MGYG_01554 [Nannizzia gypsea CBS 118893]
MPTGPCSVQLISTSVRGTVERDGADKSASAAYPQYWRHGCSMGEQQLWSQAVDPQPRLVCRIRSTQHRTPSGDDVERGRREAGTDSLERVFSQPKDEDEPSWTAAQSLYYGETRRYSVRRGEAGVCLVVLSRSAAMMGELSVNVIELR